MAMMRTRTKSRGMCLCLLGIALALLVQPSTESLVAAARGVPGLKDSILVAKRHPLHAGVARRAGAAQEDNSGQDRRDLEEVVAEADRVLEDNGTVKETKAVLRKAQKIYPGKWTLSGLKDELQQKLREFVEEAKAASKGLKEDLLLARQQQASAQRQVETAQQQVEMVMKSLVKAAKESKVELPRFNAADLSDLEDRFLNRRINNQVDRPFEEREAVVESVVEQMEEIQRKRTNKPTVLALWSPRGTGKTSLIRHLAKVSNFSESRRCGRLLVFDAQEISELALQEDAGWIASAIVVWHLSQLLHGYSIEVSGLVVSFQRMEFIAVLKAVKRASTPNEGRSSFEVWLRSFCQERKDVFEQWLLVTAAAFNATPACPCLLFLDQAELLEVDELSQHRGQKSVFTQILSRFPQRLGMFSAGTVNILQDRPSDEYTMLKVQKAPALEPLSLQAARRAMKGWRGTQYQEEEFNKIYLFSAGVPRLLEAAFQTRVELASTAQVALNAMSNEFESSYADAAPYFAEPKVALSLVLCSAVRWPAEGNQFVPGTSLRWSDIFRAAAAFPKNKSVLVPRLWWCKDTNVKDALQNDLKQRNISLEGLLPDLLNLLIGQKRGATERGRPWQELVANSLAARFHLHCIARNLSANVTWIPFLEIYPTEDLHLRAVLEPFEVCWSDGVEYPTDNEASVKSKVGKAIKSNRNIKNAHHDLLIPVKRKATPMLEFIAVQCCYGLLKNASQLSKSCQDKTRKPRKGRKGAQGRKPQKEEHRDDLADMANALLQICSTCEDGRQNFQDGSSWAKRQQEKRYSLMSCRCIISEMDVLQLL
ncbi:unnamed protein product [Effrenium voratum]|uniref:Uncharacterized protein n=1 Tax=Effrenium voratum TaxID=2562239 RepID=A0AA36IDG0_9DINO|nr:unnamed protein product [Effrenium voratum]CAJ1448373.1 unnamed protein product [Effrenium voratum]